MKMKNLPLKDQSAALSILAELLTEGFSLNQGLDFLLILIPKYTVQWERLMERLTRGESFEMGLKDIGMPLTYVAQIFYARQQGRFNEALKEASDQMKERLNYTKQIHRLLLYPAFMSGALFLLLFGMRQFLLPQLMSFVDPKVFQEQLMFKLIYYLFTYLPQIVGGMIVLIFLIVVIFDAYLMKLSYLKRYLILKRLPLIRRWAKDYTSYRFTKEIGYFLQGGFSLRQSVEFLTRYPIDPLLSELAQLIEEKMKEGDALPDIIQSVDIFNEELTLILHQGEMTSQMASKCLIYAQKTFNHLMTDIAKKITYIQPILFILIALLIMAFYLMMLLPLLTMEGL